MRSLLETRRFKMENSLKSNIKTSKSRFFGKDFTILTIPTFHEIHLIRPIWTLWAEKIIFRDFPGIWIISCFNGILKNNRNKRNLADFRFWLRANAEICVKFERYRCYCKKLSVKFDSSKSLKSVFHPLWPFWRPVP